MGNKFNVNAQDVIEAQKHIISDLQHQNLLQDLTIGNLQSQLDNTLKELEKYLPEESAKE